VNSKYKICIDSHFHDTSPIYEISPPPAFARPDTFSVTVPFVWVYSFWIYGFTPSVNKATIKSKDFYLDWGTKNEIVDHKKP